MVWFYYGYGDKMEDGTICKRTIWNRFFTGEDGRGLYDELGRMVLGTDEFSVAECKTEQEAKQKIRDWYCL